MTTYSTSYVWGIYLAGEDYVNGNSLDDHEVQDFPEEEDEYSSSETFVLLDIYVDINPNEPETIYRHLPVTGEDLLDNQNTLSLLSIMLSSMDMPPEAVDFMVNKIVESARETFNTRTHWRSINMVVVMSLSIDDNVEFHKSFVPASESSIEELEKVRVEGFLELCTVCLDEILVGAEAIKMPCTHVYHGDCIKKWLMTSNLCPLCRFSMPSS